MPGAKCLTDHVRASSDGYVLIAGRPARLSDRPIQTVHEGESALARRVVWVVRHDEERHTERVLATPRVRGLVHTPPDDDGADTGHAFVEVLLVRARRLALRLGLVGPRAAEDPVVQSLAAVAQAVPRLVVRTGDVPVERDRDRSCHRRHRVPSCS